MVSDAKIVHATIHASQLINVPISEIWDAYEDTSRRAIWGVPDGDSIIYEESRFYEGGQERYRCGPADSLSYCVQLEYVKIVRGGAHRLYRNGLGRRVHAIFILGDLGFHAM